MHLRVKIGVPKGGASSRWEQELTATTGTVWFFGRSGTRLLGHRLLPVIGESVSRPHAVLFYDDGVWSLVDCSFNGTRIAQGGEKLHPLRYIVELTEFPVFLEIGHVLVEIAKLRPDRESGETIVAPEDEI